MAYTNNMPLVNQQIATTQPLIEGNFNFLQTGLGLEHNFNTFGTGNDMYHLKASMPNLAGPETLPVGTNGMYYVLGGLPKFVNVGGVKFIQTSPSSTTMQSYLTGLVALSVGVTPIVAIPNNAVGTFYIFNTTSTAAYSLGQFVTSGGILSLFVAQSPNMVIGNAGLTLAAAVSFANSGFYKYLVVYFIP
jgi:hypothetical protein